jgi:hypothetical protein
LTIDNAKLRNENNKLKKERKEIMRRGDNAYSKYKNAISKNNVTRSIPITIYGVYDGDAIWISKPTCPLKPTRLYKTVKECYVETTGGDKLYFSSGKKNVFDEYKGQRNNEKIECDYSKTHGIMHNCAIEDIKKVFRR